MSKGKTKLTLSIDTEAVRKGKQYSRRHRKSLSALIEQHLLSLSGKKPKTVADTLTGIIKLKKGETVESILAASITEKHLR